jgi:hypothetical protein
MNNRPFAKLRGLIVAKFGTYEAFAREMPMSRTTLSAKLGGKVDWQGHEIAQACALLGIPLSHAYEYDFF